MHKTGDDNKLNLTSYQWEMTVNVLQELLDKGVISDRSWVEKAKMRTLTVSELTWLNLIIMARK